MKRTEPRFEVKTVKDRHSPTYSVNYISGVKAVDILPLYYGKINTEHHVLFLFMFTNI